MKVIEKQKDKD